MKKVLLFLMLVLSLTGKIYSQGCTVTASIPRDTIVCGDNILLSAFGRGQGIALLSENFNTGTYGPGWAATQQAMWNNPCSPGGVDGTTHIWMGNSSPVPRVLTTTSFNLSSCVNAGVTICFDMIFATQGNSAPCEGPDEPLEGVYLQYSIDNGVTWTTINYFDPNGGNDPTLINWNNWCFPVPAAALTANTKFRWYQDADSGADYDHWGIDNVVIYCNDPTYNVVWQHDGYNSGPTGGVNPTPVAPRITTSYVVVMSNGTVTCRDTVTVVVRNPIITVTAESDTTLCSGQCTQLNALAKVVTVPGGTRKYRTTEPDTITSFGGSFIPALVNINVTNLNMTTVGNGAILAVCIDSASAFDIVIPGIPPLIPPIVIQDFDMSQFIFELVCPDGSFITLVPDSTTTGNDYLNTCFVPGGSSISNSSTPYSGNFNPSQPFTNLNSCSGNGIWSLRVSSTFGMAIVKGWSITFSDPEISYTGNFNWSPTTNMTGSSTLTPTVCPPNGTNTYTITVSDTAGCVTQSDDVNVTVQACCGLSATVASVQPACGAANGSINVTPAPAGTYSFAWSDGPSVAQNRTGLAAGSYTVTITDNNDPTCTFDTTITLNSNSTLSVTFTNPVNPTCAGNDGSITVNLAGGTPPYNVTVDTGGTPITFPPIPFPISQAIPGLPAGTVNVSVTDALGCIATATATLTAPTNCCTFTVSAALTQPGCAQTNGDITLTTANGSGNYSYAWGGGLGTTNSISGVGAGNYPVTITDNAYANCFIDTSFALSNPNAPSISNVAVTDETCAGNDGAITVTAAGGTPPLAINWSSGPTSFTITNLASGTYDFTVTDASSCAITGTATVTPSAACCFLATNATAVPPTCGLNNASITINITTAGTPPYTYSIDGTTYQSQNIFSSVAPGNYNVITLDANACSDTVAVVVPVSSNNLLVTIAATDISCFGANDGTATANVAGGTTPYTYIWNSTATSSSLTNLSAGTYSVTVTDQSGCSGSATSNIAEPSSLRLTLDVLDATCFGAPNGTIDAIVSGGTPAYSFQWTGGLTSQNITGLTAGAYAVTVTDNTGCSASASANVNEPPVLTFNAIGIQVRCPGEQNGAILIYANGGGTPPYNYSATQDGSNFVFATNDTIMNLASGTYDVILSDDNGCTLVEDVLVPAPVPDAFTYTADSTSCYGTGNDGSVRIDGTTPQNSPYKFGIDGGMVDYVNDFYNLTAGSHVISAVNGWGCSSQINVFVPEPAASAATILPGDTTIELGESISLSSTLSPSNTGAVSYLWTPATGLSCTDCPNPTVYTYSRSTQYLLTVTYNDFCKATADVTIQVASDPEVFVPNSFSPNGDGNNDKWMIYGGAIKVVDLKIFNRWGEKIYETNNMLEGWDGTYKGALQNSAVYVYEAVITYLDDKKDTRMGSILLLR